MSKPIRDRIKGLRQRQRADGSWRVWWEPMADERKLGFEPLDLWPDRPQKSINAARDQNRAVQCALKGETARARKQTAHTIDALIEIYKGHDWFTSKRPGTQRGYRTQLRAISKKWGHERVTHFDDDIMETWHSTLKIHCGTNYAGKLVGMMKVLFDLAEKEKWRPRNSNPCTYVKRGKSGRRSRYASWEELDALLAAAQDLGLPSMAAAIALSFYHDQRETGVIEACRREFIHMPVQMPGDDDARDMWIWDFTRSKNQRPGTAPLHPEAIPLLLPFLDNLQDPDARLLVEERLGRPYDMELIGKRFGEVRKQAARAYPSLTAPNNQLQFRDLRRSASTWARIGGASKEDVGDLLGNTVADNPVLAATYMPAHFYSAARAIEAIRRPEEAKRKKA